MDVCIDLDSIKDINSNDYMTIESSESSNVFTDGVKHYKNKNYKEAFKNFMTEAKNGNINAEYNIGAMYLNGFGTKKSSSKGEKWILKAAKHQNKMAQLALVKYYYKKNKFQKSLDWVRIALENGAEIDAYMINDLYKKTAVSYPVILSYIFCMGLTMFFTAFVAGYIFFSMPLVNKSIGDNYCSEGNLESAYYYYTKSDMFIIAMTYEDIIEKIFRKALETKQYNLALKYNTIGYKGGFFKDYKEFYKETVNTFLVNWKFEKAYLWNEKMGKNGNSKLVSEIIKKCIAIGRKEDALFWAEKLKNGDVYFKNSFPIFQNAVTKYYKAGEFEKAVDWYFRGKKHFPKFSVQYIVNELIQNNKMDEALKWYNVIYKDRPRQKLVRTVIFPRKFDLDKCPLDRNIENFENKVIFVDRAKQIFGLYEFGKLIFWGKVNTGRKGMETPKGKFTITYKIKDGYSRQYKAPMPFALNVFMGVFIHSGYIGSSPSSHGCIRVKKDDAKWLFDWAELNTRVIII